MMDSQIIDSSSDSVTVKVSWGGSPAPGELALWLNVAEKMSLVLDDDPADGVEESAVNIVKPSYWAKLALYLTPGMARPVVALVGPAGNGKTTVCEAMFKALGIPYEVLDITEFVEPADLIGSTTYILTDGKDGKEVWRDGIVTRCFREGKALLINEFDAANPRAALCLQSAFQSAGLNKQGRYVTTPDGRVYPKGDCPILLTMNTYGSGANRQYVGRNALDAASLDRITVITTGYENELDILTRHGFDEDTAQELVTWALPMRERIDRDGHRVILSNRTLLRMAQGMDFFNWSLYQAAKEEFFGRLDEDVRVELERPMTVSIPAAPPSRRFGT